MLNAFNSQSIGTEGPTTLMKLPIGRETGRVGTGASLPAAFPKGRWMQSTTGARWSSLESEWRELSNVSNPCDDLTQRKGSKIVN